MLMQFQINTFYAVIIYFVVFFKAVCASTDLFNWLFPPKISSCF